MIWLSDVQQHTASGNCAWSISLSSGAEGSPQCVAGQKLVDTFQD